MRHDLGNTMMQGFIKQSRFVSKNRGVCIIDIRKQPQKRKNLATSLRPRPMGHWDRAIGNFEASIILQLPGKHDG